MTGFSFARGGRWTLFVPRRNETGIAIRGDRDSRDVQEENISFHQETSLEISATCLRDDNFVIIISRHTEAGLPCRKPAALLSSR